MTRTLLWSLCYACNATFANEKLKIRPLGWHIPLIICIIYFPAHPANGPPYQSTAVLLISTCILVDHKLQTLKTSPLPPSAVHFMHEGIQEQKKSYTEMHHKCQSWKLEAGYNKLATKAMAYIQSRERNYFARLPETETFLQSNRLNLST